MRLLLPALLVALGGCGTVVPYSLAPGWLAPDLVPDDGASAVVVTGEAALAGRAAVEGRVLDAVTGEPVAGAAVTGGAGEAVSGADGRFTLSVDAGGVALQTTRDGYAPAEARVEVGPGVRQTVLVVLAPDPPADG